MEATEPFRITFVCTGNTCRSPMAEVIARKVISDKDIQGVAVHSAGTHADSGAPASDGARWAAAEAGLSLDEHQSTPLTEAVVDHSDLILTMGSSHLQRVLELGGAGKAHRLRDFVADPGDVVDPFGGPAQVYQATFTQLLVLVEALLLDVAPEGPAT